MHGTSGRLTRPETSWRKVRSPSNATVRTPGPGPGCRNAQGGRHHAVDPVHPSIGRTRGGLGWAPAYHSRSRMGMDAETTRVAPVSAAYRWTARATSGSLSSLPRTAVMASCARRSSERQSRAMRDRRVTPSPVRRRASLGIPLVELGRHPGRIGPPPPRIDHDHPRTRPVRRRTRRCRAPGRARARRSRTTVSGSGGPVRTMASAAAIVPSTRAPESGRPGAATGVAGPARGEGATQRAAPTRPRR